MTTLQTQSRRSRIGRFWPLGLLVLVSAGFASWVSIEFGSLPVALHYLRGERLIIEPVRFRLNGLKVDAPRTVPTYVRNYTRHSVNLLGAMTPCSCVGVQNLPATIPPGETYRLDLKVRVLPGKTELDQTIVIFTDCPERIQLGIHVQGSAR